MNAQVAIEAEAPAKDIGRRRIALPKKAWKIGLIAALIAAAGIWWLTAPRTSESTDNAYLQADASEVAPRVGGLVTAVLVRDNQAVKAGDPLVRNEIRMAAAAVIDRDHPRIVGGVFVGAGAEQASERSSQPDKVAAGHALPGCLLGGRAAGSGVRIQPAFGGLFASDR